MWNPQLSSVLNSCHKNAAWSQEASRRCRCNDISGKQQVLSGGHPQYPVPSTFLAPTWGNTGHTPSRHHLGSSHQNSLQSWAKTLKMQISSWGIVWHSQIKPCLSFLPVEFSTMRASWKLSPTHSLNYQRVGCTSWYLPSSKNDHESKKVSNF